MYLPIAVEKALTEICHAYKAVTSDVIAGENLNLLAEASVYHAFLNKVAQACDNAKGGDTVTAVTVKQAPGGPVFVLAFNRRSPEEAEVIAGFLRNLFTLVRQNPENLNPKPLQKRVLWRILRHHVNRVEHYLNGLIEAIMECVEYCLRHGETNGEKCFLIELRNIKEPNVVDSATIQELRKLKTRAEFPRDIWTSESTKDKCKR
jgi:hypothetical protein